jgi:hypothetical protein
MDTVSYRKLIVYEVLLANFPQMQQPATTLLARVAKVSKAHFVITLTASLTLAKMKDRAWQTSQHQSATVSWDTKEDIVNLTSMNVNQCLVRTMDHAQI